MWVLRTYTQAGWKPESKVPQSLLRDHAKTLQTQGMQGFLPFCQNLHITCFTL
jgi:hypothetical protein